MRAGAEEPGRGSLKKRCCRSPARFSLGIVASQPGTRGHARLPLELCPRPALPQPGVGTQAGAPAATARRGPRGATHSSRR